MQVFGAGERINSTWMIAQRGGATSLLFRRMISRPADPIDSVLRLWFFGDGVTQIITAGSAVFAPDGATSATLECIGAGGNGFASTTNNVGTGGGGGGYSRATAVPVAAGEQLTIQVAIAGSNADTFIRRGGTDLCLAKPGTNAADGVAGTGGQASAGVGDVKFSGGNGGGLGTNNRAGAGGGGAAGPNGAGANGGTGGAPANYNGAGGGGNGGGSAGGNSTTGATAAAGGNNSAGSGGGVGGSSVNPPTGGGFGTAGGGGGGGGGFAGSVAGARGGGGGGGVEWGAVGSGGGGGGGGGTNTIGGDGGNGGGYGAGGGGAGWATTTKGVGGLATQGAIRIVWTLSGGTTLSAAGMSFGSGSGSAVPLLVRSGVTSSSSRAIAVGTLASQRTALATGIGDNRSRGSLLIARNTGAIATGYAAASGNGRRIAVIQSIVSGRASAMSAARIDTALRGVTVPEPPAGVAPVAFAGAMRGVALGVTTMSGIPGATAPVVAAGTAAGWCVMSGVGLWLLSAAGHVNGRASVPSWPAISIAGAGGPRGQAEMVSAAAANSAIQASIAAGGTTVAAPALVVMARALAIGQGFVVYVPGTAVPADPDYFTNRAVETVLVYETSAGPLIYELRLIRIDEEARYTG